MAVTSREAELVGDGIKSGANGSWVQNMFYRRGAWEVRSGFGQVAQLDTTMAAPLNSQIQGMKEHLGSHLMLTDFGHRQVVNVFRFTAFTGNEDPTGNQGKSAGTLANLYSVTIYDLETDRHWEEVLHRHTSENNDGVLSMDGWRPNYETSSDRDLEDWVSAGNEVFFFTEIRDLLFFGSPTAGMWLYQPALFGGRRIQQADGAHAHEWGSVYGESSLVTRVVPGEGIGTEFFVYTAATDMPPVVDAASIGNRLAWAGKRIIYFSDIGQPGNYIADNFIFPNLERDISAIVEHNGSLIIFTEVETWIYRLSTGTLASLGLIERLDDNIGCLNPNALAKMGEALVWVDINGVYAMGGTFQIQRISGDIDPFFRDFFTSPLTSFYTRDGATTAGSKQPNSILRFDPSRVSVTWVPQEQFLLVTVPGENLSLVLSEGNRWSIWTYESNVKTSGGQSTPGVTQNISNPWPLADDKTLLLVGSLDTQTLTDGAVRGGLPKADNVDANSLYLLEHERGGGLDRSSESLAIGQIALEDDRVVMHRYITTIVGGTTPGTCYIEKWIEMPVGYTFPDGSKVGGAGVVFLLPIHIVLPDTFIRGVTDTAGPDRFQIYFQFDNTNWIPSNVVGTSEVDFIVPTERLASIGGYQQGAPIGGMAEVQVYDFATGVPSSSGDQIRINWSGALAPATWSHWPRMNLTARREDPVIFIPMVKKTNAETSQMGLIRDAMSVTETGTAPILATGVVPAPVTTDLHFFAWEQWNLKAKRVNDTAAQPVDWAYKSGNISPGSGDRLKARGLFVRLVSRGRADDLLDSSWLYGLFNTIVGSDWKQWMSQIIDYGGSLSTTPAMAEVRSKSTIRSRVAGLTGQLRTKVFGAPAPNSLVYGNVANPSTGNLLISDEESQEIATSDSTKGHSFSYMLHGSIQNKAEKIILRAAKATFRVIGGRRRRGH